MLRRAIGIRGAKRRTKASCSAISNEHQHLEIYLGFIVRLAHALKKNQVDNEQIVAALRTSYFWHADLATGLLESARKQIADYNVVNDHMIEEPIWMSSVSIVTGTLMRHTDSTERNDTRQEVTMSRDKAIEPSPGDQMRGFAIDHISTQRLYQSAWVISAFYLSLLIVDVTKDGLVPACLGINNLARVRLWIIIPTLLLYYISAFEAYLWLNPSKDTLSSPRLAGFKAVQLAVYLVALISQVFLARACTDASLTSAKALAIWVWSLVGLLGLYAFYNGLWFIRRWLHPRELGSPTPTARQTLGYVAFYAGFALVFIAVAFLQVPAPVIATMFMVFFLSYVGLWRGWYVTALRPNSSVHD